MIYLFLFRPFRSAARVLIGCALVPFGAVAALDFGDARNTFPVTLAQDGARHQIVPGFHLGATIDAEADGLPGNNFDGDDLDNTDDEDGVTIGKLKQRGTGTITVTVTDDSSGGGFVDAWIDYNNNGNWETNEHIFNGLSRAVSAGTNVLAFDVPEQVSGSTAFWRVRLSRAGGLAPTGEAPDGEVEDGHARTFEDPDTEITGRVYLDNNYNGVFDAGDLPVPAVVFLDSDGDGIKSSEDLTAIADPETGIYRIALYGRFLSGTVRVLTDSWGRLVIIPIVDYSKAPLASKVPLAVSPSAEGGAEKNGAKEETEPGPNATPVGLPVIGVDTGAFDVWFQTVFDPDDQTYHFLMGFPVVGGCGFDYMFFAQPIPGFATNGVFYPTDATDLDDMGNIKISGYVQTPDFQQKPACVNLDFGKLTVTGVYGEEHPAHLPAGYSVQGIEAISKGEAGAAAARYHLERAINNSFDEIVVVTDESENGDVVGIVGGSSSPVGTACMSTSGDTAVVLANMFPGGPQRFSFDLASYAGTPVVPVVTSFDDIFGPSHGFSDVYGCDDNCGVIGRFQYGNFCTGEKYGDPGYNQNGLVFLDVRDDKLMGRMEFYNGKISWRTFWVSDQLQGAEPANGYPTNVPNRGILTGLDFFMTPGPPPATQADLGLVLEEVNPTASVGQSIEFTVVITNTGPSQAGSVRVDIEPPDGLILTGMTSSAGVCDVTNAWCEMDALAAGEEVTVTVAAQVGVDLHHGVVSATARSFETFDPVLENNSDSALITGNAVSITAIADGTNIVITAPVPVTLEQSSTFTGWQAVPGTATNRHVLPADGTNAFFRAVHAPADSSPPFLDLFQLTLDLDDGVHTNSDWGAADLTYVGATNTFYFNLSTSNSWTVQNLPIECTRKPGEPETLRIHFPISTNGVRLPQLNYGFSLTTNTLPVAPLPTNFTVVFPDSVIFRSGFSNQTVTYEPATDLVGGTAVCTDRARPVFPNHEQGVNECAPGAIRNSLEYLNDVFAMGIDVREFSMDRMKTATAWNPDDGAPVDDLAHPTWVQRKREYMTEHSFPIATEETRNAGLASAALRYRYDVEIVMTGHAACVVRATRMANGRYLLVLQDDLHQGRPGGLRRYHVILDPTTGTLKGSGGWSSELVEFVIERPTP